MAVVFLLTSRCRETLSMCKAIAEEVVLKKSISLILYSVGLLLLITAVKIPFLYDSSAEPVVVLLYIFGGIVFAIAWVSALMSMAQLHRWGWFLFLLLLSIIAVPIYIFWGPTPEKVANLAAGEM
jgi:hypothetical protein